MNNHHLRGKWQNAFGTALPVGFSCRESLRHLWLRIHGLPASKRYADTEEEKMEILRRHNSVADFVLGNGNRCDLFISVFGKSKNFNSPIDMPIGGLPPTHVMSHQGDEGDLEFFSTEVVWRNGAFDQLILSVADDKAWPIFFANISNRSAYAPYDGGADLFFPSSADVASARRRFAQWISDRDDGL